MSSSVTMPRKRPWVSRTTAIWRFSRLKVWSSQPTRWSGWTKIAGYIASSRITSPFRLNRWNRSLVFTIPTMLSGFPSHTGMRVWAVTRAVASASSSLAVSGIVTTFSRGTMVSRTRLSEIWSTLRT